MLIVQAMCTILNNECRIEVYQLARCFYPCMRFPVTSLGWDFWWESWQVTPPFINSKYLQRPQKYTLWSHESLWSHVPTHCPPPRQKKRSLTYFLSQPCFTALSLCQGHIIWLLSKYIPIPIANVAYRATTANVLSTYLARQALAASPPWGSVSRKRRLKAVPRLFVTSVILVTSQQRP